MKRNLIIALTIGILVGPQIGSFPEMRDYDKNRQERKIHRDPVLVAAAGWIYYLHLGIPFIVELPLGDDDTRKGDDKE